MTVAVYRLCTRSTAGERGWSFEELLLCYDVLSIAETHYVVDASDDRQYIEINEHPTEEPSEVITKTLPLPLRNEDGLWDKDKIKMLLDLSVESRFQNPNPKRSQDTGTVVKWPYHQYFERIFYNYSPNVRSWDKYKTKQLLDAYAEIAHKFRDPKYQKKELWKDISTVLGEPAATADDHASCNAPSSTLPNTKNGSQSSASHGYMWSSDFQ
ncbi:hypothetical protein EVAR_19837_1 [Eumeta japonica]|uniref:MADF domain-containing protein n=1 Tax=Eumeta variegata TaxID=151549 RepID=A0A4C1UQP2_EUMVA|nr:hypothetical protein EVAR_19837_1 [Eumeta japonica]